MLNNSKDRLPVFWNVREIHDLGAIKASVRDSPVFVVIMHVRFTGLKGHHGEIAGKNMVRPLFLLIGFFCLVEILLNVSGFIFLAFLGWEGKTSWSTLPAPTC